jgi:hypothetical protein
MHLKFIHCGSMTAMRAEHEKKTLVMLNRIDWIQDLFGCTSIQHNLCGSREVEVGNKPFFYIQTTKSYILKCIRVKPNKPWNLFRALWNAGISQIFLYFHTKRAWLATGRPDGRPRRMLVVACFPREASERHGPQLTLGPPCGHRTAIGPPKATTSADNCVLVR